MNRANEFEPDQEPSASLHESASEPESAVAGSRGPLFSPRQILGATIIGSPLAGFWLMASNYQEMGRDAEVMKFRILGVVVTVVTSILTVVAGILTFTTALPSSIPRLVLPIGYCLGVFASAKHLQGSVFHDHIGEGGARQSNWIVA